MHAEEVTQQTFVTQLGGIEHHPNRLRVAGASSADLMVSRLGHSAAGVAHSCFQHARNFADDFVHAPEAAPGQNRGLALRRGRRFIGRGGTGVALDQARLDKRLQIRAITFGFHFLHGNKFQRRRIDAVTQSGWPRPILKDVAEVRISLFGAHFDHQA